MNPATSQASQQYLRGNDPSRWSMLRTSVDTQADGSVVDKSSDAASAPFVQALKAFRRPTPTSPHPRLPSTPSRTSAMRSMRRGGPPVATASPQRHRMAESSNSAPAITCSSTAVTTFSRRCESSSRSPERAMEVRCDARSCGIRRHQLSPEPDGVRDRVPAQERRGSVSVGELSARRSLCAWAQAVAASRSRAATDERSASTADPSSVASWPRRRATAASITLVSDQRARAQAAPSNLDPSTSTAANLQALQAFKTE